MNNFKILRESLQEEPMDEGLGAMASFMKRQVGSGISRLFTSIMDKRTFKREVNKIKSQHGYDFNTFIKELYLVRFF